MASCEKCWHDAGGDSDKYSQLLSERKDKPCSLEEQAGIDAEHCKECDRKTIHQHTHYCLNRDCSHFGLRP